jgi:hypothetical protein
MTKRMTMTKTEIVKDLLDKAGYGERTDVSVKVRRTVTGNIKVVLRCEEGTSRQFFMNEWMNLQAALQTPRNFQDMGSLYQPEQNKGTMEIKVLDE